MYAHTTGESLILPAANIILSTLFDEKATKQVVQDTAIK